MSSLNAPSVRTTLEIARELGLLQPQEVADVMAAFEPDYPLADALPAGEADAHGGGHH